MKFNLYLPPQAQKSKVPLLIWLSGLTCTGDNCAEKGFFQHGASKKGIAVLYPDTSPRTKPLCLSGLLLNLFQAALESKAKTKAMTSVPAQAFTLMQQLHLGPPIIRCIPT